MTTRATPANLSLSLSEQLENNHLWISQSRSLTPVTSWSVSTFADFQIEFAPLTLWRQRTSDLPSPLSSPIAAIFHLRFATLPIACSVALSPDFQLVFTPVLMFSHRMSDLPSPLKSPTPATRRKRAM